MKGLASFMRNVLANPYLRNDHTLRMFLTVEDSGAGEWEQAKKVFALPPPSVACCDYHPFDHFFSPPSACLSGRCCG